MGQLTRKTGLNKGPESIWWSSESNSCNPQQYFHPKHSKDFWWQFLYRSFLCIISSNTCRAPQILETHKGKQIRQYFLNFTSDKYTSPDTYELGPVCLSHTKPFILRKMQVFKKLFFKGWQSLPVFPILMGSMIGPTSMRLTYINEMTYRSPFQQCLKHISCKHWQY